MKATSVPRRKYQIASVSKQFTAAAILLLEDEGKLSLDDKVSKWVPDVTDADKISIRQLLSHTPGIQDYWPQDYASPRWKGRSRRSRSSIAGRRSRSISSPAPPGNIRTPGMSSPA
jgi:CubicO group peptidase (beta-lactamase class C family)